MVNKGWIILLCAFAAYSEISEDEGVWVLTDSNFEEALNLQPNILVEFYAPWCGHCKSLAPEYAKAAKKLASNDPPIHIAKVDATVNTELAQRFSVNGYPTLKYFVNKEPTDYTGGRTEDTIISWILKRSGPSVKVVDCACDIDNQVNANKVTALLIAGQDSSEGVVFDAVSKAIDGVGFIQCTSNDCAEKYGVSMPSLILFKQFDEKRVDFTGSLTSSEVSSFINMNKVPSVIEFNQEAIELIFRDSNPVVFLFSVDFAPYAEWFTGLSKEYKGTLLFCSAEVASTDNGRLGQFLGLKAEAQPTALILDPKKELAKYRLDKELTEQNLRNFIENWKSDTLTSFMKSQEVPADPFDNGVRIVVAKNFEEVVMDKKKDVLLEFYAPWCGHCKSLAPEYEKLAQQLKGVNTVVVAKMDATENEVKGQEIKGFPTIRFFPANNKKGVEFDGERNAEGLLEFIKKNSYYEVVESKVDL